MLKCVPRLRPLPTCPVLRLSAVLSKIRFAIVRTLTLRLLWPALKPSYSVDFGRDQPDEADPGRQRNLKVVVPTLLQHMLNFKIRPWVARWRAGLEVTGSDTRRPVAACIHINVKQELSQVQAVP